MFFGGCWKFGWGWILLFFLKNRVIQWILVVFVSVILCYVICLFQFDLISEKSCQFGWVVDNQVGVLIFQWVVIVEVVVGDGYGYVVGSVVGFDIVMVVVDVKCLFWCVL